MSQKLNLKIQGLYNNPNNLSEVPPGALSVANNVVIDKESIVESRRGQGVYGDQLSVSTGKLEKLFNYKGSLIANYNNKLAYDSDDAGTWVEYSGTYSNPDTGYKIRSFEANRNFYITTSEGIKKLDEITGSFKSSGAPRALDGTYTIGVSPGFLTANRNCAYRIVWLYKDANNNEIVGAPSQRLVVSNTTSNAVDIDHTWYIPSGITTSWYYRLYRSGESADASSSEPNDELQLVKESQPTSTDITNGYVTFTDATPNTLRGATIYTADSQQGILNANTPPPFAKDVCVYKGYTLYANTRSKQRYTTTLIGVGDYSFGYHTQDGDITNASDSVTSLIATASKVIQDLTYTAATAGASGNDVTIAYTVGGTAGSEVVSITDSNIEVQIEDGVSTATQIKAAIDASAPALALATVAVSGTGATSQDVQIATSLTGGFDTTLLNVGMKVKATGIPGTARIESIDTSSSITLTENATATTSGVSIEFQDIITIAGQEYYAASATNVGNREVLASISGTPAENIDNTSLQLIFVVNQNPSNTEVYATYLSGYNDLPGRILFEEREVGGSAFSLTSTNGDSFSPTLSRSGTSEISTNDEKLNRIHISKFQQPESCPLLNYIDVGSADSPIKRIISLSSSVFILKDDGIYRLFGEDIGSFTQDLFDNTVTIKAPEAAVPFQNQIYMFSDQGVVAISDSGVQVISRPIENTLLTLSSDLYTNFETETFAVSYESSRQYILYTVTEKADTFATQAFVYNNFTNSWTKWIMERSCGIINKRDNKLYMGHPSLDYVYKERKNLDLSDYADESYDVTISAVADTVITLSSVANVSVGMSLKQSTREAVILSIDGNDVTLDKILSYSTDAAQVFKPIETKVTFVIDDVENPGILKHFREVTLMFRDASFRTANVDFSTNFSGNAETVAITPVSPSSWGSFVWGSIPWGGSLGGEQPIRLYVPLNKSRANWLTLSVSGSQAFTAMSLAGYSLIFTPMSERFR